MGSDGTIYASASNTNFTLGGTNGWLYAINTNGAVRWKRAFPDSIYASPVIAPDGTIYFGTPGRMFYAIDRENTVKWTFEADHGIANSAAVGPDGTIYFDAQPPRTGTIRSVVYALNPDGKIRWTWTNAPFGGPFWVAPVVRGDGSQFFGNNSQLMLFRPDGSVTWVAPHPGAIAGGIALAGDGAACVAVLGSLPTPSNLGSLWMRNSDGTTRWTLSGISPQSGPVIGSDGTIYLGTETNQLLAVTAQGAPKWRFQAKATIAAMGATIAADGTIYFGTHDGMFYSIDLSGVLKWQFDSGGLIRSSPLVVPNGDVSFGTDAGVIWCLEGDAALANSDWPTFQRNERRSGLHPLVLDAPAAPQNVQAGPAGGQGGMIRITWESASRAQTYELWRGTVDDSNRASLIATNLAISLEYNDDDAAFGVPYYYWVRAINQTGAGAFSAPATATQTTKLWDYSGGGFRAAPVAADDGTIYVGTGVTAPAGLPEPANEALAFGVNGEVRWRTALPGPVLQPPSIGPDGTVYFITGFRTNSIVAMTAQGAKRWETPLEQPAVGPLSIAGDGTLYHLNASYLVAICPEGNLLWKTRHSGATAPIPVIGPDGTIYFSSDPGFRPIRPDGESRWFKMGAHSQAVVSTNGNILLGDRFGNFYAMRPDDGTYLWGTNVLQIRSETFGEPVIGADGTIFVAGSRPAILAADGRLVWKSPIAYTYSAPPCLGADGLSYWWVSGSPNQIDGLLVLARDGSEVRRYPLQDFLAGPPILLKDGVLCFTTRAGKLVAYQLPTRPETGPWVMSRRTTAGASNFSGPAPPPALQPSVTITPFLGWLRVS